LSADFWISQIYSAAKIKPSKQCQNFSLGNGLWWKRKIGNSGRKILTRAKIGRKEERKDDYERYSPGKIRSYAEKEARG
jgi:hypothetical protein